MIDVEAREAAIEKAFSEQPDSLLAIARRAQDGEWKAVCKVLENRDIPHLGALAEASQLRYMCWLVTVRHKEGNSWWIALERTRLNAMRMLMGNAEAQADAWARAHAEAQRLAAGRFIRDTEHLTNG